MKLGIFAKTFSRPTLEQVLDAVADHGFTEVQFNLSCAGLPTLPERIDETLLARIRRGFESRGLRMAAVSGTFNMIHPVPGVRELGFARLQVLADAASAMGTEVITLCTGTGDCDNMWRRHPENNSAAAWSELLASMERALGIADKAEIVLAVEPEVANIMNSSARARQLLDHFKSRRLKIVMDPANLFPTGELAGHSSGGLPPYDRIVVRDLSRSSAPPPVERPADRRKPALRTVHPSPQPQLGAAPELARMHEVISEAFQLLAGDIVLAHAKDLTADGDGGHEAAGTGVLDYEFYIQQLDRADFEGPLILHSLAESQVTECVRFLKGILSTHSRRALG